jgi:hypothetical protein
MSTACSWGPIHAMPIDEAITDLAIRRMRFAKRGHAADYRWDSQLRDFGVRVYSRPH